MRGPGSDGTARPLSRAVLALAVTFCVCSQAWCIGDANFDTPGLLLAAVTLLGGSALLCSPLFLLVTWASVKVLRVSGVGPGRVYLLVLAEIALGILAVVCMPGLGRGETTAHTAKLGSRRRRRATGHRRRQVHAGSYVEDGLTGLSAVTGDCRRATAPAVPQ